MKKFSKKTVALALVVAMLLASIPSLAFADDPADPMMIMKMDSDYHKKGDEITVEIWVYNASFNVAGFCLEYDSSSVRPKNENKFFDSVFYDDYSAGKGIFDYANATIADSQIKAVLYVNPNAVDAPAVVAEDNKNAKELRIGNDGYNLAQIKFVAQSDGTPKIEFATSKGDADFDKRTYALGYKGQTPENAKTSVTHAQTPAKDAATLEEMIASVGSVEISDEKAITAAVEYYNSLSGLSKELAAKSKATLDEMISELDALLESMGDEDIAKKVSDMLISLSKTEETDILRLEAEVSAAKKAYNALTDAQKALVNSTADAEKIISEAQAKLDKLIDEENTEKTISAIESIADIKEITVDNISQIKAAKALYDSLSETGKARVGEELKKVLDDAMDAVEKIEKELVKMGDVDGDGEVSAKDATQILRHINGKVSALSAEGADTALLEKIADVDSDGEVSAKDVTQILRHINGKTSVFDSIK